MWNVHVHGRAIAAEVRLDIDKSLVGEDSIPSIGDELNIIYDSGSRAPGRVRLARQNGTMVIDVDPDEIQKRKRWIIRRAERDEIIAGPEHGNTTVWIVVEGGD